jgi:hypothetical protein
MNRTLRIALTLGISCLMVFSAARTGAFSLLGPFQPWMQQTNDLRQQGDIGGPMCISNGYRWNVPVVTYGFDPSFIQYFGTNGETAVESAIQIINNLPPASQMALTNLPYDTTHFNASAQSEYLLDLKSTTLSLLLEQLGLAQPTRYIYVLQQWNPAFTSPDWTFPEDLAQFNFDPKTLSATPYVNNELYSGALEIRMNQNYIVTFPVAPGIPSPTTVADRSLKLGAFYAGLSYDDFGGLKYLYSTNTIQYETLLSGVSGVGTNSFVNGAWRPGIDKITFIAQPVDSVTGAFLPTTNFFMDTYISNGIPMQQQLARVIRQPDFLFCAGNVNYGTSSIQDADTTGVPLVERTGTTNWVNNAALNGNPGGDGPGIIRPQAKITFGKLGNIIYDVDDQFGGESATTLWGSFDATTNLPIIYPVSQRRDSAI